MDGEQSDLIADCVVECDLCCNKGQKTCVWVGKSASVQGHYAYVEEVQRLCSRCCAINVFDDHNEGGDTSCNLIAHRKALVGWKKEMSAVSESDENTE